MVYPYLGDSRRNYPQYRDLSTGTMLTADPGGSYGMEPVQGAGPVTVPPNDGLWGKPVESGKPGKTVKTAAAAVEGD